jgi:hypothetical protein
MILWFKFIIWVSIIYYISYKKKSVFYNLVLEYYPFNASNFQHLCYINHLHICMQYSKLSAPMFCLVRSMTMEGTNLCVVLVHEQTFSGKVSWTVDLFLLLKNICRRFLHRKKMLMSLHENEGTASCRRFLHR